MKKDDNLLYIFLHIPKCAGTTFRYHVEHNFKQNEILDLPRELLKLAPELSNNISNQDLRILYGRRVRIDFQDLINNKKASVFLLSCAETYFSSLSEKQKNNIKIIYGHEIPWGIHRYFNKIPRYIVFVRNPIERTISCYNFLVNMYFSELHRQQKIMDYNDCLLINGKIPSFEDWLNLKYNTGSVLHGSNVTIKFLLEQFGYTDITKTSDEDIINSALNKFYFVGITEQYDEDALFLYYRLGVNKFFENQNISLQKHFALQNNEYIKNLIIAKIL